MASLLSVREAQSILLDSIHVLSAETVAIRSARGRVLAETLDAKYDMPFFTNSSVDGFAVRAVDTINASLEKAIDLEVVGDIPAGSSSNIAIHAGQAARIMTGAALPNGTDAVVMVEATDHFHRGSDSPLPKQVRIHAPVHPGDSIRPRGQDVSAGARLFSIGHLLRPQDIGLLASQGYANVLVYRQPRVALLSSGDELMDPSQPLTPGKIYDANTYLLSTMLEEHGAVVTSAGFVQDDEASIREKLDEMVATDIDLLITSAGVSVGAYDYVRKVIMQSGELIFWKVNMRPGKPLAFGNYRGIPVIGLPGNPVSAFVGGLLFVVPAIRKMCGDVEFRNQEIQATLLEPVESDGRESYLRANLEYQNGKPFVRLSGHQGSANLFALTRSNALLILPSGVKSLPAGFTVKLYPLSNRELTGQ